MKARWLITTGLLAAAVTLAGAQERTVMVGGESMLPSKNIIANAMQSKAHTTLVAAVKAAGLVDTLEGPGPFTVFAPTNQAFDALPDGTVQSLLRPANKGALTKVLTYHVVAGRLDSAALWQMVREGGGTATLTTVEGGTLKVMANGPRNLVIEDAQGHVSEISTYDVYQSNGVIHVVTRVLMPK
ncbi:MAG: fasciclin domain-containing protein [Vicinamibacterales bacterium]